MKLYTTISDPTYSRLTLLIKRLGTTSDTSSDTILMKASLPILIAVRGLILPSGYRGILGSAPTDVAAPPFYLLPDGPSEGGDANDEQSVPDPTAAPDAGDPGSTTGGGYSV